MNNADKKINIVSENKIIVFVTNNNILLFKIINITYK